ncbi:MAG: Dihydroneopterin aldolase (EC [uncultured Sulfurovum sp.]|uniref:Dihydroneopterin aldolase (EC) n=1 Tax=uncultured Sulfurovum sp. TaxID=269237 RepID=A0A6S6TNT8_9BACT|nr:MAG: Dihydroneopterin aldolase (EC [uncultured Sulfurovum sp.]
MTIHIEDLTFNCIIGILEFERTSSQEVVLDLKIDYDYQDNDFINYAEVITFLQQKMVKNKYELLETALNELGNQLIIEYPRTLKLTLKITKTKIIKNAKVALSKTFIKK